MTILVTGGAGFIGSNFILNFIENSEELIVNFDKLTYAGNVNNLSPLISNDNYKFIQGDIVNQPLLKGIIDEYAPRAIINFAAESHVDRSIDGPNSFIETNILGTFSLLEASKSYWETSSKSIKDVFRVLHVSTDEVYGSLEPSAPPFSETTPYAPNSPYSASKASADHLVRAYHHTYGLPTLTTNCSNNYGPLQFPEKLIPLIIINALDGKPLPVYGDGQQIRDWLYVKDHCSALETVLEKGEVGEVYNIGGDNEWVNIDIVKKICSVLDIKKPRVDGTPYANQIEYVTDRLGHDRRYAVNSQKIRKFLGWQPSENFDTGIIKTIDWYLEQAKWIADIKSGAYQDQSDS